MGASCLGNKGLEGGRYVAAANRPHLFIGVVEEPLAIILKASLPSLSAHAVLQSTQWTLKQSLLPGALR